MNPKSYNPLFIYGYANRNNGSEQTSVNKSVAGSDRGEVAVFVGAGKTASSRGRGLLEEKRKTKDEMGVWGGGGGGGWVKGKMPTGINCSMVVVVNDDL